MNKKTLKGGEFLIRSESPENVFTPEDFNEEHKMVRDMCRDFLDKEILSRLDEIDKAEKGTMEGLLDKAADLGLLSMSLPEEYEGSGMEFNSSTIMTEVIGAGHSFPVSLLAHTGIGTLPVLYFGNEEQKKKYLPKLAKGELKACYALTEPGSGSDALSAKTKAEKKNGHYILNGQKMWITNAAFADIFIVFAQVSEENKPKGFTAFIIERNAKGLSVGHNEYKMGIKGSPTNQVFFEDCKVPEENILGEIGKGHLIAFNILNIGRFKLCAATLGASKRVCKLSVQYALERKQFKRPIAEFGAIQHKLAQQAVNIFACESALYRASNAIQQWKTDMIEEGKSYSEALLGAAKEYAVECAILKVFGSEMLDYVVDEGVQVYGGYGFSEEYPVARAYRDSRINRIFEGTNEINRLLMVDMLIKKALKGEMDLMTPAKAVQNELMSIPDMDKSEDRGFAAEEKAVENMKKAILMTAGAAMQQLQDKLEEEQEIVMNAADMLIRLYISESILLRVKKMAAGGKEYKIYKDILHIYIYDTMDDIGRYGKTAINSFTSGDQQRMMLMGLKRFTKYNNVNTKDARRRVTARLLKGELY